MTHVILTAIGADRPGIVDEVSEFIFQRAGNIEDSRMVNLGGQFAMVVLVGADEKAFERLKKDLGVLSLDRKLHAELRPASPQQSRPGDDASTFRLTGSGIDQPGLVHRVAHLLREMNVNIESLDTRLGAAPVTGAPVFEMELILSVPRSTPLSQLRPKIAGLCDSLNIDWSLVAM